MTNFTMQFNIKKELKNNYLKLAFMQIYYYFYMYKL